MALRLGRHLFLLAAVMMLLIASSLTAMSGKNDVSEVPLVSENISSQPCTQAVPDNIVFNELESDPDSIIVSWDEPDATGSFVYQVLYWDVTTTTYKSVSNITETTVTLSNLRGLATYSVTVRVLCPNDAASYGLGSNLSRFSTPARAPSGFPEIADVKICDISCETAIVSWHPLPSDQWNGVELYYEVYSADITPDTEQIQPPEEEVYYPGTNITLRNLQVNHVYVVSVRAVSSGGHGPIDTPYVFSVEVPTTSPTPVVSLIDSWWGYLLIFGGAAVLVAVFLTLVIICIKRCVDKRGVVYSRDISKNIDDGRIQMNTFGSLMRADQVRLSHRGRPLPAHPLQHTPSTTSMNAHLLKDSASPQYPPMGGMAFEVEQYPPRKLPHPGGLPKLDADPSRFGPMSMQSPPFPQLSQPFSDVSSPASSVFTESNIPHDLDPRQASSSGPSSAANPYEVPADSETGHPSISPPAHMNTLPLPRRPHTAAANPASQLDFPPAPGHHPPPLTQSSLELFHDNHPAPPIPAHRANSTAGQLHSPIPMEEWKQDLAKLAAEPPDSDYSEIPNNSPDQNVGGTQTHSQLQPHMQHQAMGIPIMPSLERGSVLPSYGHEGSLVSSDQYSSYSDIPSTAPKEKELLEMKSYQGPVINSHQGQFGHSSSLSESISSFSSDDLEDHSKPPRYNGRGGVFQLDSSHPGQFPQGQSESISSASNSNTNNNNPRIRTISRNASRGQPTPQDSPLPTPYLSPASLLSPTGLPAHTDKATRNQ